MTIKRMTFLQELLNVMGLGGRLHLSWISSAEAQKFVQVVTDFTETIRNLGPNPLPLVAKCQQADQFPGIGGNQGRNKATETPRLTDLSAKCA
jgi:Methyl-viologen-reducing hydrogenase, delta subunit